MDIYTKGSNNQRA